jgi:hypothetical protein
MIKAFYIRFGDDGSIVWLNRASSRGKVTSLGSKVARLVDGDVLIVPRWLDYKNSDITAGLGGLSWLVERGTDQENPYTPSVYSLLGSIRFRDAPAWMGLSIKEVVPLWEETEKWDHPHQEPERADVTRSFYRLLHNDLEIIKWQSVSSISPPYPPFTSVRGVLTKVNNYLERSNDADI